MHSLATRQKIAKALTKYTAPELEAKLVEYFTLIEQNPKKVISIVGFSNFLGVNQTYLYQVAETKPEVQRIIETIKDYQEEQLIDNGLTGGYNSKLSMFLLTSRHGYNTQATTLVQNNNLNITPDLLADALKLLQDKN